VLDNALDRQVDVEAPGKVPVTAITCIRTQEGLACPALHRPSSHAPGVEVDAKQADDRCRPADSVMAIWRRKAKERCRSIRIGPPVHQHGPGWLASPARNSEHLTSRRGTCHNHAVARASSTGSSERIRRRTCRGREKARKDGFDDIEMSGNPKRKHASNGMLSPVGFERRQMTKRDGVQGTRGCSHVVQGSEKRLLPTYAK
jgi:putative transposase